MIRTNKILRVRMLRDAKSSAGRLLKGLVVKLPEREALAMVAQGWAVAVVKAPAVEAEGEPKGKAKSKPRASTAEDSE